MIVSASLITSVCLGINSPRLVHVDVRQIPLSFVRVVTVHQLGFASLVSRPVLLIFTAAAVLVHNRSKAPNSSWNRRPAVLSHISCQLERFLR